MSHTDPRGIDADRAYRDSFEGFPFRAAPATLNGEQAIHIRVMAPFDQLLALVLDSDTGASAAPADVPLAGAGDSDDVFAQLESEMATDRLTRALATRREDARRTVLRIVAAGRRRGVDTVVGLEDAQAMLEWFNRMYVALRTAELAAAGVPAGVGQAQSPAVFLGLGPGAAENDDEEREGEDDPEVSVPALLFALMTDMLAAALDEVVTGA